MTDKTKIGSGRVLSGEINWVAGSDQHSTNVPNPNAQQNNRYFGLSLLHWLYLFALWAGTILTWVVSQNISQFENHGPVGFIEGFPGDLEQWSRRGGWENILFEADGIKVNRDIDQSSYAFRTFALAPSANRAVEKLKVTGSINTLTYKPETDLSDGGALMLWLQDDSDKVVTYLNIGKLDGLTDSYKVSRIINLTDNITRFSLVLTNKQTSAEFELVDASIELITEQPLFSKTRIAIFTAWALMLLIALYYLFTHASTVVFGIITTVILLTVVGVMMPETISSETVKPLYKTMQNFTGLSGDAFLEYAYKIGHFVFFFLTSFLLLLYRKTLKLPVWEVFVLVILFALATEGLQLYLSDRTSRISDLIIDFSAVLTGALLAFLFIKLRANGPIHSEPPTIKQ